MSHALTHLLGFDSSKGGNRRYKFIYAQHFVKYFCLSTNRNLNALWTLSTYYMKVIFIISRKER